ncbi:hypothetical protein SRHO_G00287350 [Serrasalmus rhombeus]
MPKHPQAPPPLYLRALSTITVPPLNLESVDPEPTNSLASQLRTEPRNGTCWSEDAFLSTYEGPSKVNPVSELRVAQSVTVINAVCVEPERQLECVESKDVNGDTGETPDSPQILWLEVLSSTNPFPSVPWRHSGRTIVKRQQGSERSAYDQRVKEEIQCSTGQEVTRATTSRRQLSSALFSVSVPGEVQQDIVAPDGLCTAALTREAGRQKGRGRDITGC